VKTVFTILLGISYFFIIAQEACAFSFNYFSPDRTPIPGDVTMVLLAAGIIGIIGMTRRKFRK
jgi:hypothetical protein